MYVNAEVQNRKIGKTKRRFVEIEALTDVVMDRMGF
jgi:hypothetical protein